MAIKVNWNEIDLKHPSFFHTDSTYPLLEEPATEICICCQKNATRNFSKAFWFRCDLTEQSTLCVECVLGDLEKLENRQLDCYELFDCTIAKHKYGHMNKSHPSHVLISVGQING